MTPELHALARETAHRHTSRCTGGQPTVTMGRLSPYDRYHSAACDSLTNAILGAMQHAADAERAQADGAGQ